MEPKDIPYRSMKKIPEEAMDAVLSRDLETVDKYEVSAAARAMSPLLESKGVLRLMIKFTQVGNLQHLIAYCLQAGFDLHAKYGDAGPASLYAMEEKRLFGEANQQKKEESK